MPSEKEKMKKKEYRAAFDELAPKLGELQRIAKEKGVPVILLVEGWEGSNKGSLVNQLLQALDPRGYLFIAPPGRGEERSAGRSGDHRIRRRGDGHGRATRSGRRG